MDMLRNGSRGDAVRAVQKKLKSLGIDPGSVDGAFGPKTEAAVKRYQEQEGLQVDGIVGPETFGSLGLKADGTPEPKTVHEVPLPKKDTSEAEAGTAAGIEAMQAAAEREKETEAAEAVAEAAKQASEKPKKKRRGFRGKIDELLERSRKKDS